MVKSLKVKYIVRKCGEQWEVFNVTHARQIALYDELADARAKLRSLTETQKIAKSGGTHT